MRQRFYDFTWRKKIPHFFFTNQDTAVHKDVCHYRCHENTMSVTVYGSKEIVQGELFNLLLLKTHLHLCLLFQIHVRVSCHIFTATRQSALWQEEGWAGTLDWRWRWQNDRWEKVGGSSSYRRARKSRTADWKNRLKEDVAYFGIGETLLRSSWQKKL